HELQGSRVLPEEVLPHVGAGLGLVSLVLAVDGGVHHVDEGALGVLGQEVVPAGAPDHLDDVPPVTAEDGLELGDDLAVAADRAVESLQVAVDDPDQVVETFPRSQRQTAEGLGLVYLAVADEAPDVGVRGVVQAAVVEIAVEAGVIDGVDGPQTHGDRGELPELGHETGMRVGGEATAHLLSEQVEVLLVEPALQEGPGVEAGGGVTLEVDVVAATGCAASPEEVVEADLVEGGGRGEGREMAPDPLDVVVGLGDHHRGVPSDVPADAALDVAVTRELGLVLQGDGVDVRGRDGAGYSEAGALRPLQQLGEEVAGPGGPDVLDDLVERLLPLLSLDWVDVGKLVYELDADRFAKIARHEARLVHGGCHRTGRRSCDRSHGMTISRKRGPASNWGTCPVSSIITSSQSDRRRHTHSTAGGGTRLSDSP